MNPSNPVPQRDQTDPDSAEAEHHYHNYTGTRIPWYVHLIWVLFWCFACYYVIRYVFPDLNTEIFSPP